MKDRRWLIILLGGIAVLILVLMVGLILPPPNFPANLVIDIPVGSTTSQIGDLLYQRRVIRSPKLFELMVSRRAVAERLQAGFYQFEKPLTVGQVVERLASGELSSKSIKVTIPEGLSVEQLTAVVKEYLPGLDETRFRELAELEAGYLFPDTYLLPPELKAEQLVQIMREHFDKQIATLETEVTDSGRSLSDLITMASIVEEEVKTKTDREIVAGILWKRLDDKMRLEVDVATSTYETLGLPPAPIVNPGLESIKATLNPTATPYWFYLSDKQGEIHYAKTFTEHKLNIDKYLRK